MTDRMKTEPMITELVVIEWSNLYYCVIGHRNQLTDYFKSSVAITAKVSCIFTRIDWWWWCMVLASYTPYVVILIFFSRFSGYRWGRRHWLAGWKFYSDSPLHSQLFMAWNLWQRVASQPAINFYGVSLVCFMLNLANTTLVGCHAAKVFLFLLSFVGRSMPFILHSYIMKPTNTKHNVSVWVMEMASSEFTPQIYSLFPTNTNTCKNTTQSHIVLTSLQDLKLFHHQMGWV